MRAAGRATGRCRWASWPTSRPATRDTWSSRAPSPRLDRLGHWMAGGSLTDLWRRRRLSRPGHERRPDRAVRQRRRCTRRPACAAAPSTSPPMPATSSAARCPATRRHGGGHGAGRRRRRRPGRRPDAPRADRGAWPARRLRRQPHDRRHDRGAAGLRCRSRLRACAAARSDPRPPAPDQRARPPSPTTAPTSCRGCACWPASSRPRSRRSRCRPFVSRRWTGCASVGGKGEILVAD